MTPLELKESLLSCPGDTIQEHLDEIKMSQAELAERLGRSIPKLNELIKGKAPLTKDTATKLEYVLNIPAEFWLNLERNYQDELLKIERMENLARFIEWLKPFPVAQMKKLDLLPNTRDKEILVDSLLKFFRVGSPQQWSDIYKGSSLAFKIELRHTTEPEAISVWLRLGELQAEKISVESFSKKAIRNCFDEIQTISFKHDDTWLEDLQTLLATCGVALVYTPCIAKAPIYGATRWIKNNTIPLIQITDRQKDYHAFWFTFYHELGHILYHGKKDIFMEGIDGIQPDQAKEDEADAFAARMLLSEKERNELFQYPEFYKELILELSEQFKKHPAILVGQVQRVHHRYYKDRVLNGLKVKVAF